MITRLLALFVWAYGVWLLLTWTVTFEQLVFGGLLAAVVACALAPLGEVARPWRLLDPRILFAVLRLLVVSLGSAGSAQLEQCGLYQASEVSWRDMDATAIGFERGVVPFLDLPATLKLGPFVPGIPMATLSTGANIVSGQAYDDILEHMVDMETYAVLRACQNFGLPMIALRGISDGDQELGALADWTQYLGIIDVKLAEAVDRLEAAVSDGALDWSMP